MKTKKTALLVLLGLQLANTRCTTPIASVSPPDYDLNKPTVYKMPSVLKEISGLAFNHGNADSVYAEQDEEGKLFYFHLGDADVKNSRFSKRGDYEDVAICNGTVIMLRSDGDLFTFSLSAVGEKDISHVKELPGLLPPGEYESLYADEATNLLYLLCKNAATGKAAETISGYTFQVTADGNLQKKSSFTVDEKAIGTLAGKEKFRLKTSALGRHPVSNQWYILSFLSRVLVITDPKWKPLGVYQLNPQLFTQPEGLAFDKAGNLYISNENGTAEAGTILKFEYLKK